MKNDEIWSECLNLCEKELSKQQYSTWVKPLNAEIDYQNKTLIILAPNQFVIKWVKDRLNENIVNFIKKFDLINLKYKVLKKVKNSKDFSSALSKIKESVKKPDKIIKTTGLNKNFNFNNFVTGKANQLACAAGKQIAEKPGITCNPLFIYGGVGLGKTHLMHAIGNHLKKEQPNAKVKYLHAERYVHDVVKAYENKSFDSFKKNYHSLDLLLIDDIQFIAKKNRTQEEFFYAFNTLIENKKQIIITCDSYPKEIAGVDERLRTRFSWGLTVSIDPPELEMRVAILLKKASEIKIKLSEEVAFFVAKQIRSNVRELEGALKRVVANSNFTGRPIDTALIRDSLKDLLAIQARQVSVDNIQRTVAEYYNIRLSDLLSKRRNRSVARPRQMSMFLAKELTNHSLPEIGDSFGGRDHSTVLHACKKIKELREYNNDIEEDYKNLLRVLTI